MVLRPHTVAFDVVETLISLEPLRRRFVEIGMHASTLERWFDRMLRDGMALTLAGDYAPFPEVARAALRVIGGGRLSDDDVSHVLDGFATLPAQPDAEQAMQVLTALVTGSVRSPSNSSGCGVPVKGIRQPW